jgi:hypothetical protein
MNMAQNMYPRMGGDGICNIRTPGYDGICGIRREGGDGICSIRTEGGDDIQGVPGGMDKTSGECSLC